MSKISIKNKKQNLAKGINFHQKVTLEGKKESEIADKRKSKKGQHPKSTSNSFRHKLVVKCLVYPSCDSKQSKFIRTDY